MMHNTTKGIIRYICHYNDCQSSIKRLAAPSAINKIDYIIDTLKGIGYKVEVISASPVIEDNIKFFKAETRNINGITYKYFASIGGNNLLIKFFKYLWHRLILLFYLLANVKNTDTIIAYHSLSYKYILILARKIRKFKLIYEVEELYSDVIEKRNFNSRNLEIKMVSNADAYIFPTEMLNAKINVHNKPNVIIYGSYAIGKTNTVKFNDGKIHVVYAGTFDVRKGGAAAAAAAAHLPSNYHIHICGFGSPEDTKNIINIINEVSARSRASVSFDGLKRGGEYINFLQSCDIGLSTQDPFAKFNGTSFPSKILSYMGNGLSVVSIDIPAIRGSRIGQYISFYQTQDAKSIAKAIIEVDVRNNNIDIVSNLADQFKADLSQLITL